MIGKIATAFIATALMASVTTVALEGGGGSPAPTPLPGGGSNGGGGNNGGTGGGGGTDPGSGGGGSTGDNSNCAPGLSSFLGLRSWDACLTKDSKGVPQIKSIEDVGKIAMLVVEFLIKISGYIAVGFIVWGGIKYLKSQGDPGETTQARQIITNALMGLVLCMLGVAIIQFIVGIF